MGKKKIKFNFKKIEWNKKKLAFAIAGGTLASAGIGAGIVSAVVIPKALAAKDLLEKTYLVGGSKVDLKSRLEKNKRLKIIALGDSVTAGYNGLLEKKDEDGNETSDSFSNADANLSYPDYLVKALRGSGVKVDYKNFARTGLRITNFVKEIESGEITREMHGPDSDRTETAAKDVVAADVITLTIGANDLLAYLKFFNMPWLDALKVLRGAKDIVNEYKITDFKNPNREDKDIKNNDFWKKILSEEIHGNINSNNPMRVDLKTNIGINRDSSDLIWNSVYEMMRMASDENGPHASHALNLDTNFVEKIFDLIKQKLSQVLNLLHQMAPKAQIIVIGPTFPFSHFPKEMLQSINTTSGNQTILQLFNKLLDSMKYAATTTVGGDSAGYVSFYKGDELSEVKDYTFDINKIYNDPHEIKFGNKFKDISYENVEDFKKGIKDQINPNISDIHPSIFGHSKIGKSIFKIISNELGQPEASKSKGIKEADDLFLKSQIDVDPSNANIENVFESSKTFYSLLDSLPIIPRALLQYVYFMINDKKVEDKNFKDNEFFGKKVFEYWNEKNKADKQPPLLDGSENRKPNLDFKPISKELFEKYYKDGIDNLITLLLGGKGEVKDYKYLEAIKKIIPDSALSKLPKSLSDSIKQNKFEILASLLNIFLKSQKIPQKIFDNTKDAAFVLRQTYDFTVWGQNHSGVSDLAYLKNSYTGVAAYFDVIKTIGETLLELPNLLKTS